ncbi:MAG: O-antigen ligase family protein [Opitutaceae bacterium]|jgi:hypothetical protein
MIFSGDFYQQGMLRWNLGWPTPNYAGAFLVALLPLLWGLSWSRWRWVVLAGELGGAFLLAKTYSRGAVVAWGAAWLFAFLATRAWRQPVQSMLWTARIGVFAAMLAVAGFGWNRLPGARGAETADATVDDSSIGNRLELWRGGLRMVAAAPLQGWGAGESGRAYMNWFQDVDRTEGFVTMVNSHLHVAVEWGLPLFGLLALGGGMILAVAWLGAAPPEPSAPETGYIRWVAGATGASLVAWVVANMFTTLWIEPKLWIVPALAVTVILISAWSGHRALRWGRVIGFCFGATSLLIIGLFVMGHVMLSKRSIVAKPLSDGAVLLSAKTGAMSVRGIRCHAWLDTGVLGVSPGKEMRRWLEAMNGESESGGGLSQNEGKRSLSAVCEIVVHSPSGIEALPSSSSVILFGKQAERLWRIAKGKPAQVLIIHPAGALPKQESGGMPIDGMTLMVLLPAIDETGDGARWRKWAEVAGARVCISEGVGQDIRAVWPGVIMGLKKEDI